MSQTGQEEEEDVQEYSYQQLRVPKAVRSALKHYRDNNEDISTLSEALLDVVPDDAKEMEIPEDDFVLISVGEDAHQAVHDVAGENITSYTAIEKYLREAAEHEDDAELLEKLSDGYNN